MQPPPRRVEPSPAAIPTPLRDLFPSRIRLRGEQYFRLGHVSLVQADPSHLLARVHGGGNYGVTIRGAPGTLSLLCECPAAENYWTCKHLWATLLEAEHQGRLQPLLRNVGDVEAALSAGISDDFAPDEELYDNERVGDDRAPSRASWTSATPGAPAPQPPQPPRWQTVLAGARSTESHLAPQRAASGWSADQRLVYVVNLPASISADGLVVELATEKQRADGTFDPPRQFRQGVDVWLQAPDPDDRVIAQMLLGARPEYAHYNSAGVAQSFLVRRHAFDSTLRLICATGRCRLRRDKGEQPVDALSMDEGAAWRFALRVTRRDELPGYAITGVFLRDGEEMPLTEPDLVHGAGILIRGQQLLRFEYDASFQLIAELRRSPLTVEHDDELPRLLAALFGLKRIPPIELPPGSEIRECSPAPVPCVDIAARSGMTWGRPTYELRLSFDYGEGLLIQPRDERQAVFDAQGMRLVHRDAAREAAAASRLADLGARAPYAWGGSTADLEIGAPRVERLMRELPREGWRVTSEGIAYRPLTGVRTTVRSGIDWFDVDAELSFGDARVPLARIADAVRQGADSVELEDGSRGLLTDEWRRRLAPLLATGETAGEATRFRRSQAALLDVLLTSLPEVDADAAFRTAREELRSFEHVAAADAPASFVAELRPYQREGLGWLHFLRRFSLGGILADDMGLGKTVQVLALLEARRREAAGASLVVVPKSLVFNWRQEASRFAPEMRVLEYTGAARRATPLDPAAADLVITTYGTLRQDAPQLRDIEFDYVVLDEAQAIKNASTAAAKAARLLRARHRLAMSGTPIENRVEELWSIMEFLNPGMLGRSSGFARLVKAGRAAPDDADGRAILAKVLRPVILRRTKAQVAAELPERVEQTLFVELEPAQRKFYDALLARYRAELLPHVDRFGLARSKIRILEALLRLRQAALHPALADAGKPRARSTTHASTHAGAHTSAKLDVLLPRLAEARAEQHKVLVFSQFTGFLALLRERLDADAVPYAYLDGATRDRAAEVERFQSDEACGLFLISLRAGGHGLNLTAAEYVFLLDPWWNPAVEAQAIDRAHRIGQTRHVIATRMVARDTIEEKILALQQTKRELADAILGLDEGLISRISREELTLLLG